MYDHGSAGIFQQCSGSKSGRTADHHHRNERRVFTIEYLDDNGNITGFDYDLLEAIAKEENVKLVWKDMPFDSLMGSMEAGDVQVIAAGIGPTEDRKKSVDFSDVYYTGTQCIISRKDNPIKDFEEMSGKTVAVLEGAQSDMIASGETTDYGEVKDAKVKDLKTLPVQSWS